MVTDPPPDKGRALGRLEEKQGRKIEKSGGHRSSLPSGESNVRKRDAPAAADDARVEDGA